MDAFAFQVATDSCRIFSQKLAEDEHDLEACDKLCRTALHHADHNYRVSIKLHSPASGTVDIVGVTNDVVEEIIDQRRFREAESLADQLMEHGERVPLSMIHEADLGHAHFNLAYSCYAQRTEEKLDKAEGILSTSEQWQGNDPHLIHARSYLLAKTYLKKNRLEGAENCYWTDMKGRL